MKRSIVLATCLSLLVGSLAIGAGVTFAAYSTTNLFLNPAIWEVDGPEFRIYAWNSDGSKVVWIAPSYKNTIGYYVFEYDNYTYPNLIFARMDPANATIDEFISDSEHCWNKTGDQTIPNGKNCFKITAWKAGGSDDKESAGGWETFADS